MSLLERARELANKIFNAIAKETSGPAAEPSGRIEKDQDPSSTSGGSGQSPTPESQRPPVIEMSSLTKTRLARQLTSLAQSTKQDSARSQWKANSITLHEPPSSFRSLWLSELARRRQPDSTASREGLSADYVAKVTDCMISSVFNLLNSLAYDYNELIRLDPLKVTTTTPRYVKETIRGRLPGFSNEQEVSVSYHRFRASSRDFSLSVRGSPGVIEFFILPASDVMMLSDREVPSRLRAHLVLTSGAEHSYWSLDGLPVDADEIRATLRGLFADLVVRSRVESMTDELGVPLHLEGPQLRQAVRQLFLEKGNLVQKVVSQQEEIQNRIARELHDAVISDVMLLTRSLSGDHSLRDQEMLAVLNQITRHLREICHDLAPRDLKDWGLQTVIEDLLQSLAERTGAYCTLVCDLEIPDLPNAVQLHVYRIIQECLNNIEKYAEATRIMISVSLSNQTLTFTLEDNGKGFDPDELIQRRAKEGGLGMGSIRERAELIRAFFPARLTLKSEPDKGTTTTLELNLAGGIELP